MSNLFEQKAMDIILDISPNDTMYQCGNKEHYYSVGQSALDCINLALFAAGRDIKNIKTILDLPSGYGRVLRFLEAFFSDADVTACDIERDAVDFCYKVFSARPVYSSKRPADICVTDRFDLIWCGSLLTHLNFNLWSEFLIFFNSVLNSNGVLVFTTHGRYCAHRMRTKDFTYGLDSHRLRMLLEDFDRNGFGFVSYENDDNYGISLTSPSYVLSLLQKISDLKLLIYLEKGWDSHHDVIGCIKAPF